MIPAPSSPSINADTDLQSRVSAWFETTWRDVKGAYTSYHQMAMEAILMQAGQTWTKFDASRKVFEPDAPADDWTPTPQINRFAPTVDAIAANVMQIPEVEATPVGRKDDQLVWGICDVASALADDWLRISGLRTSSSYIEDDRSGEAGMAFVLCGCVFTEVCDEILRTIPQTQQAVQPTTQTGCQQCGYFNRDSQPIPGTDTHICPQCNTQLDAQPGQALKPVIGPDGQPVIQNFEVRDAKCYIRLPLFVLPRPGSRGMSDAAYVMVAEREEINYIRLQRGIDDANPDSEHIDGFMVGYEHALSYFYQGVSQITKSVQDSALVVRAYVEPGKLADFPDGFIAVYVNGKVKRVDPWPSTGCHPLTYAVYQRLLTLFMGRSVAFELAGLQKEYQSYESMIKLHGLTSAVEPIVIDVNTQVNEITGRADKIIKWRAIGPGAKEPHRMQHGSLDEGIYRQRQSLRDEFENTSGAVSVYRGIQPGSITAASAIDKLQGQAEMMFSKPTSNWHGLWSATVRKAVLIRQQRWTVAQIAEVVGDDKLVHIQAFKQANLDKTIDWVASLHGLPRSRDQKKQEMMQLWDAGALDISDPNVRETIFQIFGDLGIMNNFNLDATRARVENRAMQSGEQVVVMPEIEDLNVHLAVHLEAAKKLDFDTWNPMAKQMMMMHIMQTRMAIQAQTMEQMAAQGPGAGADGGGADGAGGPGPSGSGGPRSNSNGRHSTVPGTGQPNGVNRTRPAQGPTAGHRAGTGPVGQRSPQLGPGPNPGGGSV